MNQATQVKTSHRTAGWMLAGLMLVSGCAALHETESCATRNWLNYRLVDLTAPRTNRMHVLHVDLARTAVEMVAIATADPDGPGPAEATLTDPRMLAEDPAIRAFVNANPWEGLRDTSGREDRAWRSGQAVDVLGYVTSAGHARSPAQAGHVRVGVDTRGRLVMDEDPDGVPLMEAVGGWRQIVRDGEVVAPQGGPLAPRTAVGIDREGQGLWLVVVDGRQSGYSEGLTCRELADLMRDLGCWNAANMDGGGSSIMGIREDDGRMRILNRPSDRAAGRVRVRPVPVILALRVRKASRYVVP